MAAMKRCGGAVLLLAACLGAAADPPRAWLDGFEGGFPSDILFVKGKKVAGTTMGGVVRRVGARHGVAFFSPLMPKVAPASWRSGGRERWVLDEFRKFAEARPESRIGWGQEQTLSPRRKGLNASSGPLERLAARALRVTVVREPVAHAISSCTHFGPCGARSKNTRAAYNASVDARVRWVAETMTTSQMLRFVAPDPARLDAAAAADFYHAILLADAIDESLVALASAVPSLSLADVLYVSAKTNHNDARRPAPEKHQDEFKRRLRVLFYGPAYADDGALPDRGFPDGDRPATFSPDAHLYYAAKARLRATVAALGTPTFKRDLRAFKTMQQRMLKACAKGSAHRGAYPGNLKPRDAAACIYGDQGCGYRCLDAWVDDRDARLATRAAGD